MKTKTFILTLMVVVLAFTGSGQTGKLWPLSTNSEEAKDSFNKALDRLWNARLDEYQLYYEQALKADPGFFLARANDAILTYTSDKEKGLVLLKKVLEMPQDKLTGPEKELRMVLVDMNENKPEAIKVHLDNIIRDYPDDFNSYGFASSISTFIIKDQKLRYEYDKKGVGKFPESGVLWNQLGYYYMETNELDKAEEALNNYLRLCPSEANTHDSYGDFCMKKGNYNIAQRHYETAVAMGMKASGEKAEKAKKMAQK